MSLTVLAVADQISPALYDHFQPARWRHIDLVVSCGDLSPDYLDMLGTNLGVPVFYVHGNHDGSYRKAQYDGAIDVDSRIVTYRGIRIAGFEGCMTYNHGAYQFSEAQMRWRVRRMRLRTFRSGPPDVIISHAPPAGCHDGKDLCHRGFHAFRTAIELWHPQYFIHGHIHAYEGATSISTMNETTIINAFPYEIIEVKTVGTLSPNLTGAI
ncbi:MAG: metallophosphoesterase family protein [Chloroflexota bacterium]